MWRGSIVDGELFGAGEEAGREEVREEVVEEGEEGLGVGEGRRVLVRGGTGRLEAWVVLGLPPEGLRVCVMSRRRE